MTRDSKRELQTYELPLARGLYFHRDGKRPAVAAVFTVTSSLDSWTFQRRSNVAERESPLGERTCNFVVDGQETKHRELASAGRRQRWQTINYKARIGAVRSILPIFIYLFFFFFSFESDRWNRYGSTFANENDTAENAYSMSRD